MRGMALQRRSCLPWKHPRNFGELAGIDTLADQPHCCLVNRMHYHCCYYQSSQMNWFATRLDA